MKKKKLIIGLLLLLSSFSVSQSVSAISVSQSDIEVNAVIKPYRIWTVLPLYYNAGPYYFYQTYNVYGPYEGYLQIDWGGSIGGIYFYRGYIYPTGTGYPIPAKVTQGDSYE